MGNIEILSFAGSDLESLPTKIRMLTSLRVLDLSGCQSLEIILPNIIGCLSKLEGLYMPTHYSYEFPEALMAPAELKQLPNLTTLELHIEDESLWPEDLIFNHLSQFKISIGTTRLFSNWVDFPLARILKLSLHTSTPLKDGVMELLKTAEVLLLIGVKNLRSVPPVCLTLRRLFVVECEEVTNIFSPTAFCVLETLFLSELPNLIEICHGQLPSGFFCELQELTLEKLPMLTCTWEGSAQEILSFSKLRRVLVQDCPKLKNLFSHSIAKDLLELVTLQVKSCELVQEIFGNEREEETTDTIVFPSLRSLNLSDLQNFISFSSKMKCLVLNGASRSHTEGILFHKKVSMPSLENLKIYGLPNFKQIWTNGAVRLRELKLGIPKLMEKYPQGNLQNLCSISISKCQNLTHLFSPSMARGLVRLQNLEIEKCGMMKDIFMEQCEGELEAIGKFVFPQLQTLKLRNLPLTTFFPGMGIVFPQLHVLTLQDLPSFTTFCHGGYSEADLGISMQPLFNEKVEFPNLEILEIGNIENFQVIFHNQLPEESFCQLRELKIAECHKLLGIAKSKILGRLKNLNKLEVQICDLMEEIFELEDFDPEGIAATSFVQLKQVRLNSLPKLGIFCSGNNNFNFSSLETMSLAECPMMDKFSSGLISMPKLTRMTFSYLRKTTVDGSRLLKHRDILRNPKQWKGDINVTMEYLFQEMLDSLWKLVIQKDADLKLMWQLPADNYSTLKILKVRSCHEVSTVFPFKILQSLQCLEVLYVEKGRSVEEVFKVEGHVEEGLVTARMLDLLRKLRLRYLPKLKHIWWDKYPNGTPGFQNLSKVIVFGCGSLESLFPSSIASTLVKLRVLRIESCSTMKTIIAAKEIEGEEIAMDIIVVFPQLHTLSLRSLPNMVSFYTGSFQDVLSEEAPQKENLCISIQPFFDNKVAFPSLEILKIHDIINLQTIFHNQLPDESFGQLKELQVTGCRKLLNVGKSNIPPRLKNLKELQIGYCHLMEEIFELEEHVAEGIDSTSFVQLKQVKLESLPKLKIFCLGNHNFNFSSLETMSLVDCPMMDKLSSGLISTPKLNTMNFSYHHEAPNDIFRDPNQWKGDINATMKYLFQEMLDSSRVLVIQDAGDLNWMLQRPADNYSTLKKLEVRSCHEVSTVFPFNFLQGFHGLEELYVEEGNSVKDVFEEGLVTAGMLDLLKKLRLRELPKLKHIWWDKYPNGTPGFQNLCEVIIIGCDSLKSLFPSSIASTLVQLRVLRIENCLTMKTIIAAKEIEGEEIGMNITVVFPQLHSLSLFSLPNMASFYTGSFRDVNSEEAPQKQNLCISIQPLFDNKVAFPNLEYLQIRHIENLQTIFHNQLPDESFGQLKELQVAGCDKLLNVAKSNILPRLKNLKELEVRHCELMEEIFELEEHVAEGIDSTSFSQLRQVELVCLPKLKTFCSGNHSFEFSSLEILKLERFPLMDKF